MDSLSRVSTHTVSMTLAKNKMCVMEFGPDQSMDMFQVRMWVWLGGVTTVWLPYYRLDDLLTQLLTLLSWIQ